MFEVYEILAINVINVICSVNELSLIGNSIRVARVTNPTNLKFRIGPKDFPNPCTPSIY